MPMLYLVSLLGSRRGAIPLVNGTHTIGREAVGEELMSGKLLVSRSHCDVLVNGDVAAIRDHSLNGTRVNGISVDHRWFCLLDGDVITLGAENPVEGAFAYKLVKV